MNLWYVITLLGTPEFWIGFSVFLIGLYFFMRGFGKSTLGFKRFLILMIPSLLVALFLTQTMKFGLAVPRPCIPCPAELCNPYCTHDFSFPSGHTATMFTVLTAGFLVSKKYKKQIILGYIIPLVISLSRIMLGVHTLIDIIGGALIGMFIPILVLFIYRKYKLFKI